MDPLRDTPLKRFGALWIGLFIALSFVLATLILVPFFTRDREDPILQAQYDTRLETKAEVDKAQAEQLAFKKTGENANVPPAEAFKFTAAKLLSGKAKKSSTIVPGSETATKASAAPAAPAAKAPAQKKPPTPQKAKPAPKPQPVKKAAPAKEATPVKKAAPAQKPAPAKKAEAKATEKKNKDAEREALQKARAEKKAAQGNQNAENPE